MKRKDLTAYIREQIIDELSESTIDVPNPGTLTDPQKQTFINKARSTTKNPKLGTAEDPVDFVEEADLEEMARKAGSYKVGNTDKLATAKEIYTTGLMADVLNAIEEAGENGLTQKELGAKLGINDTTLNPILNKFLAIGVFSGGKLAAAAKPEKGAKEEEPEVEEPETLEPEKDEWESPEEEEPETSEEEPTAVSDKEVEKTVGKAYAELSPEEEDVFGKFKQAIINKAKILTDKKASKDDKTKAQAAIDNYKAKADLKKIFAKKGLNLIDFINGELKK